SLSPLEGVQALMVRSALFVCLTLVLGVDLIHAQVIGAQDIARLQSGVVKITAQVEGKSKEGTGVIVRLESDAAYILTAAHVVAGDPNPKVEFFTNKYALVSAQLLPGTESGDEMRGLALLLVRGKENLPTGTTALPLDGIGKFSAGDEIIMVGFPRGAGPWHVIKGNIGSTRANDIFFSPSVDTGNSGGPIVRQGKVIGIVMATELSGRGLTANRAQAYIAGFEIAAQTSTDSLSMASVPSPPPTATAKPEPRQMTQDREITGRDGAPMVLIPTGESTMGSPVGKGDGNEHPQHQVYLDAFDIDKFEVTVARYAEFLQAMKRAKPAFWDQVDTSKHGNLPVVGVDWNDAEAYCRWAKKRLPTEAEWEKAARGTDERTYPWGNEAPTSNLANFGKERIKKFYDRRLAPVGSYEAGKSPYGIYDLAGNVWEWVADWDDESYYEQSASRNPPGPSSGIDRVIRGGSWLHQPDDMRSAGRDRGTPTLRNDSIGFRCARDSPK
ncbi:MAG: SUMF1/EgtB/PvdO family nonheme iron enzyme, partial [Nitrospirales bacterium]